jgi:hypothetical protein
MNSFTDAPLANIRPGPSRRELLRLAGTGFGMLGLAALLADDAASADYSPPRGDRASPLTNHHSPLTRPPAPGDRPADLLAVRPPHHAPRARRCIFLYMPGGPSQLDTFDPKPRVARDNGQPLPFEKPRLMRNKTGNLLASPWKFQRHGQSGIPVSSLFPNVATCVDELCVIRSMVADNINHTGASLQMNTGEQAFSRPCLGSWLIYGLGSENRNLPGFVVISQAPPPPGASLWSSSFLPAAYQGTWIKDLSDPIRDLNDPLGDVDRQRRKLDLLRSLNELHEQGRGGDPALDARIASFELAFRMQLEAPEAFSLGAESAATRRLYGIDDPMTAGFGNQCLLARRLVERGVRFVQVYDTAKGNNSWDHHSGLVDNLTRSCAGVDRPIAGLLLDLKARGLLDDTLVVWGGEFGRTPTAEGADGREHHPFGFTMWLAGGGVKGGHVHGATDDFGWHAIHDKVHVHDLHATILHLMGINHTQLTYRYSGRDYRLTDVYGRVVNEIFA